MIKVLATGSKGNCYTIQAGEEILLLECGIPYKDILKGINFKIGNVVGCLVTHSHKDHCKSIDKIIQNGVNVYFSKGTQEEINSKDFDTYKYRVKTVSSENYFTVGNFKVLPFTTQHDCKEPLGFLIQHKDLGKILFATDTYYLQYFFRGIDHVLIECNYSRDVLDELEPYRARILKSHMSLETLKETLKIWDLRKTKDITLIHLSENNGDAKRFQKEIEEFTKIKTYIAVQGLEVN